MRLAVLGLTLQLALTGLFAGSPAQATEAAKGKTTPVTASFDCGHASSPREHLICSDPELSALDGQLGKTYQEKRALLSPKGAELLKSSQRSWLRYISTVCAPEGPDAPSRAESKTCLKDEYTDRLEDLQGVAKRVGPYLFNRVDLYAVEPSGDNTGSKTGFSVQHVSYPQIDNADSPELVAWNQQNVRSLSSADDCDDSSIDCEINYELGIATPHLISVEWTHSTYFHGNAHGSWDVTIENTAITAPLRPLTESDIFGPGTAWVKPLKERLWRKLLESGWRPPENQSEDDIKSQLEDEFVNPDKWFFTNEGLRISFTAYEGGCYACTPQPITLSWAELKPLLSAQSIAP
jgi:uncharacterized protein